MNARKKVLALAATVRACALKLLKQLSGVGHAALLKCVPDKLLHDPEFLALQALASPGDHVENRVIRGERVLKGDSNLSAHGRRPSLRS